MRALLLAVALGWVLGPAAAAHAEPRPYKGPHPIDFEGHWHFEDSVHVHDDLPVGDDGFVGFDGVRVFLGDPKAYGYDETIWTFRGAHPVPGVEGYCGITGEHRHPFAPEGAYRENEGVYDYTGALRGGVPTREPGRVDAPRKARRDRERRRQDTATYRVAPWTRLWWTGHHGVRGHSEGHHDAGHHRAGHHRTGHHRTGHERTGHHRHSGHHRRSSGHHDRADDRGAERRDRDRDRDDDRGRDRDAAEDRDRSGPDHWRAPAQPRPRRRDYRPPF